jgi:hypothetical protein
MPRENIYLVVAIVVPFVVFALTLAWGELQTRHFNK